MNTLQNIILKQFNENMYKLFYIPAEFLNNLYDAEPVFNKYKIFKNKQAVNNLINQDKIKAARFNEFFAIRKAGEMFTYNREIVPISLSTMYYTKQLQFRFIAYTIDDNCMSFWKECRDYDELIKYYRLAFEFLNIYTEMPDTKEFEDFWNQYDVTDYDYN